MTAPLDPLGDPDSPIGEPAKTIRILVVEDQDVVRDGLVALLDRQPSYQVIGQAGTTMEAITLAGRLRPDLVTMDIQLPDGSGIEACREIKALHPAAKVVMLTGSGEEDSILMAIVAGANGFILKSSGIRDVIRAIDVVAAGGSLLDPVATDRIMRRIRTASQRAASDPFAGFTSRERQTLQLVADGLTNKQIAAELHVSEKTVKRAVAAILAKLRLERRGQAAALYVRRDAPD